MEITNFLSLYLIQQSVYHEQQQGKLYTCLYACGVEKGQCYVARSVHCTRQWSRHLPRRRIVRFRDDEGEGEELSV